jgi:hypothetical protein
MERCPLDGFLAKRFTVLGVTFQHWKVVIIAIAVVCAIIAWREL